MTFGLGIGFVVGFLLLVHAGARAVGSLTHISRVLHLSEYVVAFMLMSFATTIPELFVGVSSAVQGIPRLSLGNIVGSNIVNLTLVIGLTAFFSNGIKIRSKISRQNFIIIFLLAFMPALLGYDGVISRTDGIVLLVTFVAYLVRIINDTGYFSRHLNNLPLTAARVGRGFRSIGTFLGSVVVLIASSSLVVYTGSHIARAYQLDLFDFGLVFLSISTALPELVFGIKASLLKHPSLTIGNALGSIAFTATGIAGLVALISPITVEFTRELALAEATLFSAFLLFHYIGYTHAAISRREGLLLVALYVAFMAGQLSIVL